MPQLYVSAPSIPSSFRVAVVFPYGQFSINEESNNLVIFRCYVEATIVIKEWIRRVNSCSQSERWQNFFNIHVFSLEMIFRQVSWLRAIYFSRLPINNDSGMKRISYPIQLRGSVGFTPSFPWPEIFLIKFLLSLISLSCLQNLLISLKEDLINFV